jgi:hypothetical protein
MILKIVRHVIHNNVEDQQLVNILISVLNKFD